MAVPGRVRTEQGGMTIGPMREKQVQMEAAERTRCGGFLLAHKPTSASYRISLKCPLMKMSTKKNLNFHLFSFTSETITFFFFLHLLLPFSSFPYSFTASFFIFYLPFLLAHFYTFMPSPPSSLHLFLFCFLHPLFFPLGNFSFATGTE